MLITKLSMEVDSCQNGNRTIQQHDVTSTCCLEFATLHKHPRLHDINFCEALSPTRNVMFLRLVTVFSTLELPEMQILITVCLVCFGFVFV